MEPDIVLARAFESEPGMSWVGPTAIHRTLDYSREADRRKPPHAWTLEFIGAEHPGHGTGRRLVDLILAGLEVNGYSVGLSHQGRVHHDGSALFVAITERGLRPQAPVGESYLVGQAEHREKS
ncbi:hypothetical protein [Nocardia sp. Marseille-Q1738]